MDDCGGKRAAGGLGVSRRGSSIAFRDQSQEDRSSQYCSRLGCSTRLDSRKSTQISNPEKPKYASASVRSTSSKAIAGSSSNSFSISSGSKKSFQERQNRTSLQEIAFAECSSRPGDFEELESSDRQGLIVSLTSDINLETTIGPEPITTNVGIQTVLPDSEGPESPVLQELLSDTAGSSSSWTTASNSRPRKQINNGKVGFGNQEASSSSISRRSAAVSRNSAFVAKTVLQGMDTGSPRYGIKNRSCTSISDALISGSSSDISHRRRVDAIRKRCSDVESPVARGKSASGSSSGGYSGPTHIGLSGRSLSPSERLISQQASRRTRNQPPARDGAVSVRTRRASNIENRVRQSEQVFYDSMPVHVPIVVPQLQETQFSTPEAVPESSSRSFSVELPHVLHNSSRRPSSNGRAARSRTISRPEGGSSQIFHGSFGDRDGYRRFNVEGIAEVLLALERIEHDEELTYEQLMVLETNLFLGGLSFDDQHRDMRMDIDNMSYEELLALEEKMGNVSTALSEEQLSMCVKRSTYFPASMAPGFTGHCHDDIRCSICQEEYVGGDEVGKLACDHQYHMACIHQWLGQKNWCPICKASALPS